MKHKVEMAKEHFFFVMVPTPVESNRFAHFTTHFHNKSHIAEGILINFVNISKLSKSQHTFFMFKSERQQSRGRKPYVKLVMLAVFNKYLNICVRNESGFKPLGS